MDRLCGDGANLTTLQRAMKERIEEIRKRTVEERRTLSKTEKDEIANLTRDMQDNLHLPYINHMAVKVKGSNETEERKIKAVPTQE